LFEGNPLKNDFDCQDKLMQITFEGQYDRKLFFKAVALANRPPKNQQRLLSVLLVIAIGAIGVIGYRMITSRDWAGNFVYLAAAIFMGSYVTFIFSRPYITARKLWANPGTQRKLEGMVTNQGINYVFPEGEININWERFSRLQKNDDIVTLVRNDGLLVVFPRRFFKNEENWRKFNKMVDENVSALDNKGIQRPVRSK
jgi:hypothetical protein